MKNIKIVSLVLVVIMVACFAFGCAPKLDEEAANVAKDYYSYVVLRQDFVSVNDICAYDRIKVYEAIYAGWAEEAGKPIDEYIDELAAKRDIESDVNSVSEFFKAQSDKFVENQKAAGDTSKFDATPEVVKFSDAKSDDIQSVYDSLDAKYSREGVNIADYLNVDDIAEAKFVTVGINDSNSQVLIVKINNQWLYMA